MGWGLRPVSLVFLQRKKKKKKKKGVGRWGVVPLLLMFNYLYKYNTMVWH